MRPTASGNCLSTSLAASESQRASFAGAALTGAMMRSGGFEQADFTGADLQDAKVEGARLAGAVLAGADLRCEGLGKADLRGARADEATRWPHGFDPLSHGVEVIR